MSFSEVSETTEEFLRQSDPLQRANSKTQLFERPHPAIGLSKRLLNGEKIPREYWIVPNEMGNLIDARYVYYALGYLGRIDQLNSLFPVSLDASPREEMAFYEGALRKRRLETLSWVTRLSTRITVWGITDAIRANDPHLLSFFINLLLKNHPKGQERLSGFIREVIESGWLEGIVPLLQQGIKIEEIFKTASKWASTDFFEELLEYHFSELSPSSSKTPTLEEILLMGVRNIRIDLLDTILDRGVQDLTRAIQVVCRRHYLLILDRLVEAFGERPSLQVKQKTLNLALKKSLESGHLESVKILLSRGAEYSSFERKLRHILQGKKSQGKKSNSEREVGDLLESLLEDEFLSHPTRRIMESMNRHN